MKVSRNSILMLLVAIVTCWPVMLSSQAQSGDSQTILRQYISDLQKNPNDATLREKIIKLVRTMNPEPSIPEAARRHFVIAKTLFADSKKAADFVDAIAEFRNALLIAPWWPEANRDLGLALEAAQQFDEATVYVKLYMATNPGEERTRAAQDELYRIEAKKQSAAKAARETQGTRAEEARKATELLAEKKAEEFWSGRWRPQDGDSSTRSCLHLEFHIEDQGETLVEELVSGPSCTGYQRIPGGRRIETRLRKVADRVFSGRIANVGEYTYEFRGDTLIRAYPSLKSTYYNKRDAE